MIESPPAVIVCASPDDAFRESLAATAGFEALSIVDAAAYLPALIDSRAALSLVDARHSQARALILSAKTSAATRRIPIVLVSDCASARADAIQAGAERAIDWQELATQLPAILDDLARVPSAEWLALLDCQCAEPLPDLAAQGAQAFNCGEYYEQHDLFEAQWVATEGPARDLYRAILQVGVAYYQLQRGNYRGALKMLQRSVQWLHPLPDVCQGVDVAALRRDSYAVRAELQRLGPQRLEEFDRSLLKPLRWSSPHDYGGTEGG